MDGIDHVDYAPTMDAVHASKSPADLADEIASLQDADGCWNVLPPTDPHYPELNHYVPNYKSTIYLLSYFRSDERTRIAGVVDFFNRHQRFDDGDFRTPAAFPYYSNRSCYGRHSCYWGIVKLLKGLVHLPERARSASAIELMGKCVDFILLHDVCFRSHSKDEFLNKGIQSLSFPNMYRSDFLEILWVLKKAGIDAPETGKAIRLLKDRMGGNGEWSIEKKVPNLVIPMGKKSGIDGFITNRAREVLG